MALSTKVYYNSAKELIVNTDSHSVNTITNIISETQQTVYPIELVEPPRIFEKIISWYPELCWFANITKDDAENSVINSSRFVGHLIAYYWSEPEKPPFLNSVSGIQKINQLMTSTTVIQSEHIPRVFLHDLTIIPDMANKGVGRELVSRFLEYLSAWNQPVIISLVSVRGTRKFWEKFGFVPITQLTATGYTQNLW